MDDLEGKVRAASFRLLIKSGEAITPKSLTQVTGITGDRLGVLIDDLDRAGRIRRDEVGRIVGSAGLSVTPDRHEIDLDGRRFWTWCAYDIFGIFGALAADGRALSPSPPDRRHIEVRFARGRPQQADAVLFRPDSELMACCENVYEEWCPNSNLFASREMAERWAAARSLSGSVLSLDEAADLATEEWKSLTVRISV